MKYKGVFLQTEFSYRLLDNFEADGPLPVTKVIDKCFYVRFLYQAVRRFELLPLRCASAPCISAMRR